MNRFHLTYKQFSEHSILVEWPAEISSEILVDVLKFKKILQNKNIKSIVDVNNAYNTLLVIYIDAIEDVNTEALSLKSLYAEISSSDLYESKHWEIPVCYDLKFALDLPRMSEAKNVEIEEIVHLHSKANSLVYCIGFLPGFLYLGGLHSKLEMPRLETPREKIEKGAVGIAANQIGIYPNESPGGWNIIGNCPISIFDASANPPCFIHPGDTISFRPISLQEHSSMLSLIKTDSFHIQNLLKND